MSDTGDVLIGELIDLIDERIELKLKDETDKPPRKGARKVARKKKGAKKKAGRPGRPPKVEEPDDDDLDDLIEVEPPAEPVVPLTERVKQWAAARKAQGKVAPPHVRTALTELGVERVSEVDESGWGDFMERLVALAEEND